MKLIATAMMAAVLTVVSPALRSYAVEVPPPQGEDPSPVMVNLTEVHLCCGACVKAVAKAAKIDGVQADIHQDEGTVILTAATYHDIQQALDEIARAGFSGKIEDDTQNGKVGFPEIKTPDGNVKKLTVRHIHNCCRGCSDAIIEAIESVDGVTSNTVKPKKESFVVEGDFDPGEVVEAIQNAGFYPTIE
jgi:periplasmic mercuric ion binding protein